ncbi:pggt1b [Trichonephila clavipes]|nr:pggt1b [Trichonephila clavipes]
MHGYRLDTSCSVFTAEELSPFTSALQLIDFNILLYKYCIYTLTYGLHGYITRRFETITIVPSSGNVKYSSITGMKLYSKGFDIVFCWLPNHVGIIGNEQADSAAKSATVSAASGSAIGYEKRVIMHHILISGRNHESSGWITDCTPVKPVIGAWSRDATAKN